MLTPPPRPQRPLRVFPHPRYPHWFAWECRICREDSGHTVYLNAAAAATGARIHLNIKPHQIAHVHVGQQMSPVHWIVLDLHRASTGLRPWRTRASVSFLTVSELNNSIEWWNAWHSLSQPTPFVVPADHPSRCTRRA